MRWLAVLFWLCTGAAVVSHLAGNETAINGIVGAGLCALATTVLAAIEGRS